MPIARCPGRSRPENAENVLKSDSCPIRHVKRAHSNVIESCFKGRAIKQRLFIGCCFRGRLSAQCERLLLCPIACHSLECAALIVAFYITF